MTRCPCRTLANGAFDLQSRLEQALRRGLGLLDPAAGRTVIDFVYRTRCADGGFGDRYGASDLYYTHFAIAVLAAAGEPVGRRSEIFLTIADTSELDMVHCAALLSSCVRLGLPAAATAARLQRFHIGDGAYTLGNGHPSIYATFLANICGCTTPIGPATLKALQGLRTADGGWTDRAGSEAGTTTVSAAALLLHRLAGVEPPRHTMAWIDQQQHPHGGLRATPTTLTADLLSTATALLALTASGCRVPIGRHLAYVEDCWRPEGGFAAHPLDDVADCEYTYYALLALGAVAEVM